MKKMLLFTLLVGGLCTTTPVVQAQERLPEYLQAEKFTQEKLNTMLFSTVVDPHWFQKTRVRDNILKSKEQKNIQP
uniref:hypothetical protein n=1 Tax=Phocaeicola massiliensis TaxID=204516 RepID=UPI0022E74819